LASCRYSRIASSVSLVANRMSLKVAGRHVPKRPPALGESNKEGVGAASLRGIVGASLLPNASVTSGYVRLPLLSLSWGRREGSEGVSRKRANLWESCGP
jgi:hypothetical protein